MADWQVIEGGVTAPKGFRAAGDWAGLKPSGAPDVALIVSDCEAIAAGVFTTSQVRAACVDYCQDLLEANRLLALSSAMRGRPMPARASRASKMRSPVPPPLAAALQHFARSNIDWPLPG